MQAHLPRCLHTAYTAWRSGATARCINAGKLLPHNVCLIRPDFVRIRRVFASSSSIIVWSSVPPVGSLFTLLRDCHPFPSRESSEIPSTAASLTFSDAWRERGGQTPQSFIRFARSPSEPIPTQTCPADASQNRCSTRRHRSFEIGRAAIATAAPNVHQSGATDFRAGEGPARARSMLA